LGGLLEFIVLQDLIIYSTNSLVNSIVFNFKYDNCYNLNILFILSLRSFYRYNFDLDFLSYDVCDDFYFNYYNCFKMCFCYPFSCFVMYY
jgi:hypothetical protein